MAREQQQQDTAERDEARSRSRHCPHCSGEGLCEVFDPQYDGRRVRDREVMVRGEVKRMAFAMVVAAHCTCPMGRWVRSKIQELDSLRRIPDLVEVLAGRSRWAADDPTAETEDDPRPSVAGRAAY